MKTFPFSQWVKFELTLYKNHQFATKQNQHFVLTKIWVFSSAFALWANAELYILGTSLTYFLSFFLPFSLPFSGRKLEKYVNNDARTLKFCLNYPWTQSLRFREKQIVCMSVSLLVGLTLYLQRGNLPSLFLNCLPYSEEKN